MTTRRRTKPTRTPKVSAEGGRKATVTASAKKPKVPRNVRPAKAAKVKPRTKPTPAPKPAPKAKRKLSRRPEAIKSRIRARKRRAELRAIEEAKAAERSERAKRAAQTRKKKQRGYVPSERETAIGWLEALRNLAAHLFPVSLAITEAEASARTPWLVVGRFDFDQAVSYAELGEVIDIWDQDVMLAARINPQRLSQIRIIYNDPKDVRGASDTVVSKTGAWEYILSDLRNELIGFAPDDPDALAVRYEATAVQTIYVYFSSDIIAYRDAWRGPTQTVKLR